jgi:asparagine synthase (glutamine-hydrolysing)
MLLYDSDGQDPDVIRTLLDQLDRDNPVSRGLLLPDGEAASLAGVQRVLGFAPSWMEAAAGRMFKMNDLWASDFRSEFAQQEAYHGLMSSVDVRGQLIGRAPVNQALYLWAKTLLPGYILTVLGDRMEMAHSIEGRVPFLDHEVVELIRSMPVGQKIRGMTEKYVLREAARPVLTDTVYQRQKHPFLSPPATLNPNDRLHEMIQDALRGSGLKHVPFFDQPKVVQLLDRLPSLEPGDQVSIDQVLMLLLSASVLGERFGLAA